jgi:3-oxoacyl-[acyl-carrier-protein] synthase-3
VPIVSRIENGQATREDYRQLLLNLRQQVVEGARWIARAASNIDLGGDTKVHDLRSLFIQHARDEHRDFEMLERDYVAVGGELGTIRSGQKNVGSEALSAWMFHKASQPNPFDLMGAMFIIEGLGNRMAHRWGELIRDQLGLTDKEVSFLLYHGKNDETHFDKLETAIQSGLLTEALVERVAKTAKVTARLYLLQLEELGNI